MSLINCEIDFQNKKGLAQKVLLTCGGTKDDCDWHYSRYLSDTVKVGDHKRYDVNVRSIVAFREIGRGFAHIERFSRIMNMFPPYARSNYLGMVKDMSTGYLTAMNESMEGAASNVKAKVVVQNEVDNVVDDDSVNAGDDIIIDTAVDITENANGIYDCDVSLDGAWQRRGYSSIHGFVSAIERISDKVIDVEVLTKSCRQCIIWSSKLDDPAYQIWKSTRVCLINHKGSSSSMESNGAVKIFQRSIEKHGIRYLNYIGDGDSSAFSKVVESNPYPDIRIQKMECIGHIQKRVGANLIRLTQDNKFMKGRGEGRLTKKVIHTLQNYYGMAIRSARDTTVSQMKMAIAAVLCHCVKKVDENGEEDKADRHKYCRKL